MTTAYATPERPKNIVLAASLICIACIIGLGVFWRFSGLSSHVTYIDELMVLTDGRWNVLDSELIPAARDPFEFSKRIAMSPESSYAPLQFMPTYYALGSTQLSWRSLVGARIVSSVLSCLAFAVLLLLAWRTSRLKKPIYWIPSVTLLACSQMAILNAHQAHCYSALLAGGLLAFLFTDISIRAKTCAGRCSAVLSLAILPWLHYQLVFYTLAALGIVSLHLLKKWVACTTTKEPAGRWEGAALLLSWVLAALTLLFLQTMKANFNIAWWVQQYGFRPGGMEITGAARLAWHHLLGMLGAVAGASNGSVNRTVSVVSPFVFLLIACTGFWKQRDSIQNTMLFMVIGTAGLIGAAYLAGRVPLSPTRHSLVFLPLIVVTALIGMESASALASRRAFVRLLYGGMATWTLFFCYDAYRTQRDLIPITKESFDARAIDEIAQKRRITTIVTSYFDFSKLKMMLSDLGEENKYQLLGIRSRKQFPSSPFLLVGQNPRLYSKIYDLFHVPGLDVHVEKYDIYPFDYEPSPEVEYWPNEFIVLSVKHKGSS